MSKPKPSSRPTNTKKAPAKRLPPVTREKPKKILKRQKAQKSARKSLKGLINSIVKRSGRIVVDRGVAAHLKTLKLKFRVEDNLNMIEKKITAIFKQWGNELWKKLNKEGLNDREKYRKARKEIIKFFKMRRKIFRTYMTIVMSSIAFNNEGRKAQLTQDAYIRNFHMVMASLGMAKNFSSLATITNIQIINQTAVEIRSGKKRNKLFDIHKKLSKRETLSAKDYALLAEKYTNFLFGKPNKTMGAIERYERVAIRLILNGLKSKQRFFVLKAAIKMTQNDDQVIKVIEDFLVGRMITTAQAVYLTHYAMKVHKKTSVKLTTFMKNIQSGSHNMEIAKNYRRLRTKMLKLNFAISKSNFAVKNLNIGTIIGYELLFHGAFIAVAGGLLTGIMRSIENRRIDDILAIIQNPVFLGSLATLGVTSEIFTRRTRHGAGLITRMLHSMRKRSKKAKENIKRENKDKLLFGMTSKITTGRFFIENYTKLDRYLSSKKVTGGNYLMTIDYNKFLTFKQLKKIIPSLSKDDTFDGYKVDSIEFRRRIHLWWSYSRETGIDTPQKLQIEYNKSLKKQGIPAGSFLAYRTKKAKKGLKSVRKKIKKIQKNNKKKSKK